MSLSSAIRAGRAYFELSTKDEGMQKGIQNAQADLRRLSRSATAIGASFSAAGGIATGALFAMAKEFADVGDAVHKMNLRTGIATESLSQLAFATSQSGSSLQTLEKGMKSLQRLILDVEQGSSSATDTLEALGVEFDHIRGLRPEEQFLMIAQKVSEVDDPTRRAALSMRALGRAGSELLPMLSLGADGIRTLMNEADDLGLTLDQEAADSAAKMTDEIDRMTRSAKAFRLQLGAAVAPVITDFFESIRSRLPLIAEWAKENQETVRTILKLSGVTTAAGVALIGFGSAVNGLSASIGALNVALSLLNKHPYFLAIAGFGIALAGLRKGFDTLAKSSRGYGDELERARNLQRQLIALDVSGRRRNRLLEEADQLVDPRQKEEFLRRGLDRERNEFEGAKGLLKSFESNLVEKEKKGIDLFNRQILVDQIAEQKKVVDELADSFKKIQQAYLIAKDVPDIPKEEQPENEEEQKPHQLQTKRAETNPISGFFRGLHRDVKQYPLRRLQDIGEGLKALAAAPGLMFEQLRESVENQPLPELTHIPETFNNIDALRFSAQNTALDARTSAGVAAIVAATSRGGESIEQKMLAELQDQTSALGELLIEQQQNKPETVQIVDEEA